MAKKKHKPGTSKLSMQILRELRKTVKIPPFKRPAKGTLYELLEDNDNVEERTRKAKRYLRKRKNVMGFEPTLPALPDMYTQQPDEDFVPIEPNETCPTGYFAGPNDPIAENQIPKPRGSRTYYWWNTDPRVNKVFILVGALNPQNGKEEDIWQETDKVAKYVIDDEDTAVGKLVLKSSKVTKEVRSHLDPNVSFEQALKRAREF